MTCGAFFAPPLTRGGTADYDGADRILNLQLLLLLSLSIDPLQK